MQIKVKYFLPIWGCWYYWYYWSVSNTWSHRNWFDWVYVYGYTEMESLATYFDMGSESAHSVAGIYTDFVLLWQRILNSLEWTISDSRSQRQESFFNVSTSLVSKLYSTAVIQPLGTAEVERIFSQVALIKTSHRANIKTEKLSKILNIKYKCDLYTVKIIHVWDKCVHAFFKHKNRRLVNTMWLLF